MWLLVDFHSRYFRFHEGWLHSYLWQHLIWHESTPEMCFQHVSKLWMVAGMHLTFVYRPDVVAYTWDSLDILKVHYLSHLGFLFTFSETMINTPGSFKTGLQLLLFTRPLIWFWSSDYHFASQALQCICLEREPFCSVLLCDGGISIAGSLLLPYSSITLPLLITFLLG